MSAAFEIDLLEQYWVDKSRKNFYAYRQYIGYPQLKLGPFQEDLSNELQQFYVDYTNKQRPILIIEAPPQHGKSRAVVEAISWFIGQSPDAQTIYASFSERLGKRANRQLQRILQSDKYSMIFPNVTLGDQMGRYGKVKAMKNNDMFEVVDSETKEIVGNFRNTTVQGAVTGETLDIGVIDDPVKGRKEANSKVVQEGIWDWFTDDFYTRFNEYAGLLVILTRWSKLDIAEKLQSIEDIDCKVISFKAIAEEDEQHRKEGEPLFPAHKSLDFLNKRKSKMAKENWQALYQQSPMIKGGNIFKFDHWKWWRALPELKCLFITGDTASKKNTWNDFTVFQCWGYGVDNCIYLIDLIRKRMEAHELRTSAKLFYNKHNTGKLVLPEGYKSNQEHVSLRKMYVEDKSSGIGLIQDLTLDRVKIEAIPRNIDKIERSYDTQPEIESGKVYLCEGVIDVGYITDEGGEFPNGAYDDTIDCTMTAIEVAYIHGLSGPMIGVI